MQETFIKAYINLNDHDGSRPFSPWIYRIAHNESISFLRKRRSEPQPVTGPDALLILQRVAGCDDPCTVLQRTRTEGEAREAVWALDQRCVLILRYLEGQELRRDRRHS